MSAGRRHVESVWLFVEQKDVAPLLQQLRHVHAVALAARQLADLLLLVGPAEVEGAHIGTCRDLMLAEIEAVVAARDFLPAVVVGVEMVAALVDVPQADRLADPDRPPLPLPLAGC